jgi:hypothetical protein
MMKTARAMMNGVSLASSFFMVEVPSLMEYEVEYCLT